MMKTTTEAAHTPGPWHVEIPQNSKGVWVTNGTRNQREKTDGRVAPRTKSIIAFVQQRYMNRAERVANAQLIASAPDLLEACKMALNGMAALIPELKPETDSCTIVALNIDRLNFVIAKAEGSPSAA